MVWSKISPTKVGAQKIRQQLWAKAHSMDCVEIFSNYGLRTTCVKSMPLASASGR
ncbi:MAG: hypothetical protein RMK89_03845 [Armatimonadota bacterium]|nr:hypothetical protein [Armatimonadota bacterium]MDW8142577.1 hypothetical protein [Armatimonadota bacterium]